MKRQGLSPELRAAGARQVQARAPETITREWLERKAGELERVIRLWYPEEEGAQFPPEWDAEIRRLRSVPGTTGAIQTWAYLKHIYYIHSEQLEAREDRPVHEEAMEAARKLLTREPVVVELCGERVEVTSRSYSAMAEVAMHELAIRRLDEDYRRVMELVSKRHGQLAEHSSLDPREWGARATLRRHIRGLEGLARSIYREKELHRAQLYAHALTPDGAPARSIDEAPEWWDRTTPEDDAVLLEGLFRVGPARYAALGPAPAPKGGDKGKATPREELGFATLFASWEPKLNLEPAELYDRDLAQTLTHLRAGAFDLPEPKNPKRGR